MPIAVVCPSCKAKLKAPETLIGKTVKCPGCAKPILVKAAAPASASTSVPAPPAKKPVKQPAPPLAEEEPIDELPTDEDEGDRTPTKTPEAEDAVSPPLGGPSTDKERSTAMWIHLLPVCLACCGGIGTFISLFLWISKRKESPFIDHHGKTWLNFVINVFVVFLLLGILSGVLGFVGGLISNTLGSIISGLFGLIMFALAVYVLVMYVVAGLKAKKGEWFEYRTLVKVLK